MGHSISALKADNLFSKKQHYLDFQTTYFHLCKLKVRTVANGRYFYLLTYFLIALLGFEINAKLGFLDHLIVKLDTPLKGWKWHWASQFLH